MGRHFGDMLLKRRRQMGVSIQQVSNIVKIRPQIIEYFETENFAAMPPRGYAQGMIASYARYLGLNSHEVVEAYFDALDEYERAGGRAGRFEEVATDASPRSANPTGRYMMVGSVPPSRFAQRPAQAGYVSESSSLHEPISSARLRPGGSRIPRRVDGYRASVRAEGQGRLPDGPARRAQRGYREGSGGSTSHPYRERGGSGGQGYGTRPPAVRGRGAGSSDYRYGGDRRARQGTGAAYGGPRPSRGASSYGGRAPRKSQVPPLDMRMILVFGALAVLFIALIMALLLRGCAPASKGVVGSGEAVSTQSKIAGSSADTSDSESDSEGEGTSSDDSGADGENDGSASDKNAESTPKETVVKVSLKEKGAVAWVEVKLDGKIVLGKQVVGPFEEEFTVESQIDITTDSPSAVSVYQNGEKVRYDTKVSGVGKVTIVAPEVEDGEEKTVDSDGDGTPDMTAAEAKEAGIPVTDDSSDTAA